MLNSFQLPLDEALDATLRLDIPAVQLSISPREELASIQQRADAVTARGLKVSAFSTDVGDLGEPEFAPQRIDAAKKYLDAAAQWGNGICQAHIGVVPYAAEGARWDAFVATCGEIAAYGERVGACWAIETGPEPARVVEKLIQAVGSRGLAVNYDPANLILWPAALHSEPALLAKSGAENQPYERQAAWELFEPVEGVKRLGRYTVHAHAKDAIGDGGWRDVALGTGWVDWPRFLRLLQDNGFDGYIAIECEAETDRPAAVASAAAFLREQLKALPRAAKA